MTKLVLKRPWTKNLDPTVVVYSATLSRCKRYRYELRRTWATSLPFLLVIGLNPSTADGEQDDNTIRKCMKFAKAWGFGSLVMANLFAWRSTCPEAMKRAGKPIGRQNDAFLQRLADDPRCGMILAAWGKHGRHLNRDKAVLEKIGGMKALRINADGTPMHPLYIPDNAKPIPFDP